MNHLHCADNLGVLRPARVAVIPALLAALLFPVLTAAQPPAQSPAAPERTEVAPNKQSAGSHSSWYLGASALVSMMPNGPHNPYVYGQLGGWSLGPGFVIGAFLSSHTSAEVEVSTGTAIQTEASERISGGYRTFTASHRPTKVSAFVRASNKRRTLEASGGFVLELASQRRSDVVEIPWFEEPDRVVPDSSHVNRAVGFGGGLNIVSRIRDGLAFTAGARAHWLFRPDLDYDFPIPGPLTIQIQVGLRLVR
jgi:hypothetical protein